MSDNDSISLQIESAVLEAVAPIESERDRLQSELEALKRERAMLVDLRYELMGIAADVDAGNGFDVVCRKTLQRVIDKLSATEPQATLWLDNVKAEAKKDALEDAANNFDGTLRYNWTAADGYTNAFEIASELRYMASELRFAASKRKEQV
jgi:hypothetical protein